MSETATITIRIDKKLKELFTKLAREDGVVSQGLRELMAEAVARGYILKSRKEARKSIEDITQRVEGS